MSGSCWKLGVWATLIHVDSGTRSCECETMSTSANGAWVCLELMDYPFFCDLVFIVRVYVQLERFPIETNIVSGQVCLGRVRSNSVSEAKG